jgi:hypothetical protein
MGQKYLGTPGHWTPISDDDFHRVLGTTKPADVNALTMGKVVRYTVSGVTKIGKISGTDKAGFLLIAPVCNQSKSGYQFSTLQDKVSKSDVMGQIQTTL